MVMLEKSDEWRNWAVKVLLRNLNLKPVSDLDTNYFGWIVDRPGGIDQCEGQADQSVF